MAIQTPQFAELILPLNVEGTFTYSVPEELRSVIRIGQRVEVEFGKRKHYCALVKNLNSESNWTKPKPLLAIIDEKPIFSSVQFKFWEWLSEYYMCSYGEIMIAALPSAFRPGSETLIFSLVEQDNFPTEATDDEFLLLEALEIRKEINIQEAQSILQKKAVLKLLNEMLEKRWIQIYEKLEDSAEAIQISWIRLHPSLRENQDLLNKSLDLVQKSERQSRSLVNYLQQRKDYGWIRRVELQKLSSTPADVTQALLQKEIYEEIKLEKFHYPESFRQKTELILSNEQDKVLKEITNCFETGKPILLHGITGSGKTMLYLKLIEDLLNQGKQILYLVPEIALTSQLVGRLKQQLGEQLLEYHSDLSPKSKLSVWNLAKESSSVFIGARSSIFLPFTNLGLIIVDEEHDSSYKQNDPSPRYQARDCAVVLSKIHSCKIILGSATPSLESYYNAGEGKYHYVKLFQRFGDSDLPDIETVSMQEAQIFGKKHGHFSERLIEEMKTQFALGKQVIIFRNRRGYSPLLQCSNCHWEAACSQCDIRLTLHKQWNKLKCHICGQTKPVPDRCPDCGQFTLRQLGFGTEQIEEALQELFPEQKLQRLDLDVARSRKMQQKIIETFQEQESHILVGTQMVTKGLDFEHVGMVGVLQADQILFFPDFRSQERAFQLLTQVSGRAGRRSQKGIVIVQGYHIDHPVLQFVKHHDQESFYKKELSERHKFNYPPYTRLIRLQLLHNKAQIAEDAAQVLSKDLKVLLGKRVLGPAEPHVSKIKGLYVREILVKIERDSNQVLRIKNELTVRIQKMKSGSTYRGVRIQIDVDP